MKFIYTHLLGLTFIIVLSGCASSNSNDTLSVTDKTTSIKNYNTYVEYKPEFPIKTLYSYNMNDKDDPINMRRDKEKRDKAKYAQGRTYASNLSRCGSYGSNVHYDECANRASYDRYRPRDTMGYSHEI